ncbi:hypothetical protein LDB30_13220 [Acidithiobacillus ferrooxidans]|uniref:hypothetical protein n=1 Tax=Acidithiobacillus ferrooxidans TaxID=920 RepID=UPI001C0796C1|nr:hypothetical protein [Acidithiobacillus ferrooxidans]MBU2806731.1 hypothetical protein [Acidithiobacillus ferrooxidans F221]UBU62026.1 hypothetical protein LDB30_13220 [Acidithiobacillus ferrooxidans]
MGTMILQSNGLANIPSLNAFLRIQTIPQLPGSAARPYLESINILSIGREAF